MCVRSSMLRYIQSLSREIRLADGLLVYSFWSGYKENDDMKHFLEECGRLGLRIETLHTSGHADSEAVEQLIARVNPSEIIPVHTEVPEWFDGKIAVKE